MLQAFFFAFLATVAFGILFQGPKRILVQSGVIGAAGWLLFITLKSCVCHPFVYGQFPGQFSGSSSQRNRGPGFPAAGHCI